MRTIVCEDLDPINENSEGTGDLKWDWALHLQPPSVSLNSSSMSHCHTINVERRWSSLIFLFSSDPSNLQSVTHLFSSPGTSFLPAFLNKTYAWVQSQNMCQHFCDSLWLRQAVLGPLWAPLAQMVITVHWLSVTRSCLCKAVSQAGILFPSLSIVWAESFN